MVGICLFICLPGFHHLFIPRRWLGEEIAGVVVGLGTREIDSWERTWALFKNRFQPGWMDEATVAI